MKLYNTLTRKVDAVDPLDPPEVTVYTCGPTVYDYAHVGHWFNYVRMDTLIRALKSADLDTKWVMNITDVGHLVSDSDEGEDKLEKGARREGKTAWEVAEFYTKDFLECMKLINMLKPDHIVKATDHIKEQIELVKTLEEKGYTYVIDDGVYYDTSKFEGYTAFARLDLDEQVASGRVTPNPQKRNTSDFALWKFSPKGKQRDMEWDSPWGKGFPGWHIECSAMSMAYLGPSIDIHTGGIDHIPVHHTNEIAQSEAATGQRFAQIWMHSNHITINGEKISKSLGNGIRLQEVTEKGLSPLALRLHVLESHYRSHSKFSWESLQAAQNRLDRYQAMADLRYQAVQRGKHDSSDRENQLFADVAETIINELQNDLNTPKVLEKLSVLESTLSETLVSQASVKDYIKLLEVVDTLLGLDLLVSKDISEQQKIQLAKRQKARDSKDWDKADSIRHELSMQGIEVRDTDYGQIWSRSNSSSQT